jgi:hypothetical protein
MHLLIHVLPIKEQELKKEDVSKTMHATKANRQGKMVNASQYNKTKNSAEPPTSPCQ